MAVPRNHFDISTFTDGGEGDWPRQGHLDPSLYNPSEAQHRSVARSGQGDGGRLHGLRRQALHRVHLLAERRLSLRRPAIEVAGRQRGRGRRLRRLVPEVRHQARHLLQHAGQRLLRRLRQLHGEGDQRPQRSAAGRISASGGTSGDRAVGQLRPADLHLVRRRHAPAGQRRAGPGADPQAAPAARRDVPGAARQPGGQHPLAGQRTAA